MFTGNFFADIYLDDLIILLDNRDRAILQAAQTGQNQLTRLQAAEG